jgi:hypothetical protein
VIAVFKQKSPGNIAVLFIFGMLLKLPMFLNPKSIIATQNDGRLYHWLVAGISPANTVLFSVIAFALLYIQALMINYLVNEYRLISRQNYLAGMSFILITSLLPEWNYLSSPLVANTFVIWMLIALFRLYHVPNMKGAVYNIGLLAGISSYIYFPSVAFVLCILLGMMILKPFRLNEIVLFFLGCLTPYYFHLIYLYLVNQLSFQNFIPHLSISVPRIKPSIWLAASTLLLTVPFLIGGYFVQVHLRKMLIQARKNWSVMLVYLLLSFFIPFINSDQTFHTWILMAAPFAAFHSFFYFYSSRWMSLLFFFIAMGYVLFQQYWTKTW